MSSSIGEFLDSEERVNYRQCCGSHGEGAGAVVAVTVIMVVVVVHVTPLHVLSESLRASGVGELPIDVDSGTQLEFLVACASPLHLNDLGATCSVTRIFNINLEVD